LRNAHAFKHCRDDRGIAIGIGGSEILVTQEVQRDCRAQKEDQSNARSHKEEGERSLARQAPTIDRALTSTGRCVHVGGRGRHLRIVLSPPRSGPSRPRPHCLANWLVTPTIGNVVAECSFATSPNSPGSEVAWRWATIRCLAISSFGAASRGLVTLNLHTKLERQDLWATESLVRC
jgi:hypothetical protein